MYACAWPSEGLGTSNLSNILIVGPRSTYAHVDYMQEWSEQNLYILQHDKHPSLHKTHNEKKFGLEVSNANAKSGSETNS